MVLLALYEVFAVLALRAHWTMDVCRGGVGVVGGGGGGVGAAVGGPGVGAGN